MLRVDGDVFSVRLRNGSMQASTGAVEDADVEIAMDMATFFRLTGGDVTPDDAEEQGLVTVEGDLEAFRRCFEVLSMAPRTTPDPERAELPSAA